MAGFVCSGFAAYFSFMSWYRTNAMCGTVLAGEYASFSAFTKPRVQEALMRAEKNGLITESRLDLDAEGELRVFYCASLEQRKVISAYLGYLGVAGCQNRPGRYVASAFPWYLKCGPPLWAN